MAIKCKQIPTTIYNLVLVPLAVHFKRLHVVFINETGGKLRSDAFHNLSNQFKVVLDFFYLLVWCQGKTSV